MHVDESRLADSVNQEPIVFYDCTQTEIFGAMISTGVISILNVLLLTVLIGRFLFALVISLILALGICWGIMTLLKNIRQKYYATWFKEKLFIYRVAVTDTIGGRVNFINDSIRFGKGARRRG